MRDYNNINWLRKKLIMPISKLAAESGVSEGEILQLEETNSFPDNVETEIALARALDVPREKLFVRFLE